MTLEDMYKVVKELGMPLFTAKQLCQWIYEKRVTTFGEIVIKRTKVFFLFTWIIHIYFLFITFFVNKCKV